MMDAARTRLAERQAELVRALVGRGPTPAGFDKDRVRAVARSLVNKRRQALVRAWPTLTRALGNDYAARFTLYAESHPLPEGGSPLADGREFLRWLESSGPLADAVRMEAIAFDFRWRATPLGVRKRTWPAVKLAKLRERPTLVIALRLPWLGERFWRIPLGKK